jgi:hypothetical protein
VRGKRRVSAQRPLTCHRGWVNFLLFKTLQPCALPTLRIEGLRGQPENMADGARLVRDFQPPFGAVSKPRDGVADHVRACPCSFVPRRIVVARMGIRNV